MRNKFSTSLTLIALSLTCAATNVPSKDTATEAVVIRDYFSDSRQSGTVVPLLPKEKRLSSSASNIQIYYDELIPDTIKTAVAVAADIWESALKISVPVTVSFELAPLTTGYDTEVLVRYLEAGEDSWPCALYFNTECEKGADSYPIFATIRINDGTKWDAGFSEKVIPGGKNLSYAMLRTLGAVLGFGSSIQVKTLSSGENVVTTATKQFYSKFDKLIVSNRLKWLSDVPIISTHTSAELMDYIQPDDDTVLYLRCSGGNHKLYAPSTFEPYRSLYFLDDEESIMHYELPLSDKRLQIDDITLSVMEEIGWLTRQSQSSGVEIKGDGLADNGIASAYETHRFSLTDATGITGANWKFILPLADGSERLIKSETGVMEFTIPAISDESLYSVNVNGDIYGTVKFEGDKDGVPVTAAYRVSLELKPHVSDIYLSDIYPGSDGAGYAVTCSVAYSGGQSVVVTAEQDGSVVDRRMVDEPYLAHLSFEGLSPLYATVITAKVSNARGAAEKSVTIPAANGGSRKAASVEPAAGGIDGGSVIEVYGTDGLKLGELDGEDGLVGLSRGAYILRYRDGQNTTATKKYMKL